MALYIYLDYFLEDCSFFSDKNIEKWRFTGFPFLIRFLLQVFTQIFHTNFSYKFFIQIFLHNFSFKIFHRIFQSKFWFNFPSKLSVELSVENFPRGFGALATERGERREDRERRLLRQTPSSMIRRNCLSKDQVDDFLGVHISQADMHDSL